MMNRTTAKTKINNNGTMKQTIKGGKYPATFDNNFNINVEVGDNLGGILFMAGATMVVKSTVKGTVWVGGKIVNGIKSMSKKKSKSSKVQEPETEE